jgi:hypothetical protein
MQKKIALVVGATGIISKIMPLQKDIWNSMIEKYNLRRITYEKVAAWPFGDFIFGSEYDIMTDTTKIKQLGFHEVLDSEQRLIELFAQFKEEKLIP